jgi:hypothetical protein
MNTVDIKPAPDGEGFCLHYGKLPPAWFAHIHHAINYAMEVFPRATIRVFESESIITRVIPPTE